MNHSKIISPHSQSSRNLEVSYRSPQMRKEALRSAYINAQSLQSNVNTNTINNLEQVINEVDVINQEGTIEDKIKNQAEVILDSEIMTISSHVLKKCTLSLSKNINNYDPVEFSEKTRNFLCRIPDSILEHELNWSLLGNRFIKYFKKTATYSMISGTLRVIPKKEVVRRKIVRETQAPTKRPENIISVDKLEGSIEHTVMEIKKTITAYQKKYKKPLDFFKLVLHPTDFGKTIENILHVSFLIRDAVIIFTLDCNGTPHVERASKEDIVQMNTISKRRNIQNVISLNMKHWKVLVKIYNIKKTNDPVQLKKDVLLVILPFFFCTSTSLNNNLSYQYV